MARPDCRVCGGTGVSEGEHGRTASCSCNQSPSQQRGADKDAMIWAALLDARARIAELEKDAARYRYLRERDLDTIHRGGLFAGRVPENVVVNGDDLDAEVDAAMAQNGDVSQFNR